MIRVAQRVLEKSRLTLDNILLGYHVYLHRLFQQRCQSGVKLNGGDYTFNPTPCGYSEHGANLPISASHPAR